MDVQAAYLQGNAISRLVFLKPPKEFDDGSLWQLNKTVYGLCDAAREWYNKVSCELSALGVTKCSVDNSLFFWHVQNVLEGMVVVHVDDFLWCGTAKFQAQVIDEITTKFKIGSTGSTSFTYLGLNVRSFKDGMTLDQIDYVGALEYVNRGLNRAREKSSGLSISELKECRAKIGQLGWIATHTRPDIAFDTCMLSAAMQDPSYKDLLRVNKVIDIVKSDNIQLYFPRLGKNAEWHLECYTDAAHVKFKSSAAKSKPFDVKSQSAYIIFIRDGLGKSCPIMWQSRKLPRVVNSTLAAETMALQLGVSACIYLTSIIHKITNTNLGSITCYTDNKSLKESLDSSKQVSDPRLRLDIALLKEDIEKGILGKIKCQVIWIASSKMLADCMTKRGVNPERLRDAIDRN